MNKKIATTIAGIASIAALASTQYQGTSFQNKHPCEGKTPTECAQEMPAERAPQHMQEFEDELAPGRTIFDEWQADIEAKDTTRINTQYNTTQAIRFANMPFAPETIQAGNTCNTAVPLVYALMGQESNFRADARGVRANGKHSGAYGPMQLKQGAADHVGVNRFDTKENIKGGACYLAQHIENFGDWQLGLAAYHDGQGTVRRLTQQLGNSYESIKNHLSPEGRNHVCIVGGTLEKLLESQDNISLESFRTKHEDAKRSCNKYRT